MQNLETQQLVLSNHCWATSNIISGRMPFTHTTLAQICCASPASMLSPACVCHIALTSVQDLENVELELRHHQYCWKPSLNSAIVELEVGRVQKYC